MEKATNPKIRKQIDTLNVSQADAPIGTVWTDTTGGPQNDFYVKMGWVRLTVDDVYSRLGSILFKHARTINDIPIGNRWEIVFDTQELNVRIYSSNGLSKHIFARIETTVNALHTFDELGTFTYNIYTDVPDHALIELLTEKLVTVFASVKVYNNLHKGTADLVTTKISE